MNSKVIALIPCAGLGTRVNMPLNKSKELLSHPITGKLLIQHHIDLCTKYNLSPLIITRKEKQDLINYCITNDIKHVIIEPEGEWMNTPLMAQDHWGEYNILLLPDTEFSDESVLMNIKYTLLDKGSSQKLIAAVHFVTDCNKWGIIRWRDDDGRVFIEKPSNQKSGYAWGILGFNKETGIQLLTAYKNKETFKNFTAKIYKLRWFRDLTRG